MSKVATTKIKGSVEYAKVATRLNQFRSDNPRSKISVKHFYDTDGNLTSRAYIWRDKVDFYELLKSGVNAKDALESADSEGTSFMSASLLKREKGAEKNETIAVGRALALLGYATDGNVASSEEMEEFEQFKVDKANEARVATLNQLEQAKTMSELQKIWMSLEKTQQLDEIIRTAKDKRKGELSESSKASAK